MLMTDALLAAIIAGPVLITYFLKSNAALGFLALCAGFVLSTSVIGDLKHLLSETNLSVADNTLALILIIVPLVLTLLLSRKSAGKNLKLWLHLLVALAAGVLLALSLGPIINSSSSFDLIHSSLWKNLQRFQSTAIGVGAFVSFLLVWSGGLKHTGKKHK